MPRSVLQDEIKKRDPFEVPEQEVALNLARTADHLQAEFVRLFKARGISHAQYNVLRILRGAATALPCQEIAGRMITHLPDITRLVDRLEATGLVGRCRTEEDRRLVLVRITAAGLDLLAGLDGPVLDLHRRQLAHLSPEELAELNRLLVKARRPDGPGAGPCESA
jgi:DNA-binding MarR family transcriptional regulator